MLVYPTGIPTGGGYTIENAIWIYGTADYLQKTFTSASDDNKRYIYAFWTKGGLTGRIGYAQASDYDRIEVKGGTYADTVWKFAWEQAGSVYDTIFPQVYADDTAWRQHVMSIDTTAGTGNRIRMWTNGVENTGETYANGGETPLNHTLAQFHNTSAVKLIEASAGDSVYFAQFVGIDGLSIQNSDNAITDFGEFDDNGVWVPVNPSGLTFGTNGFHLDFAVAPGTGNGAGTDVSGNGNHFTDTSMTTAQQVTDTPTDDANNDIGNYWTLNPLASTDTLTGGNLSFTAAANFTTYVTAPALPMTGKWYYEVKATGGDTAIGTSASYDAYLGLVRTDVAIPTGSHTSNANLWVIANWNPTPSGQKNNNSTATYAPTSGFNDGSIIMVAVDMDNNAIWFGNDNTWAGSATASEIAAGTTTNAAFTSSNNSFGSNQMMPYHGAHSDLATYNFGATAFAHTPPTGFKALNTANLPAPTVTDPSAYFQAKIYTGNGGTQAITFEDTTIGKSKLAPDLVWVKCRDVAYHHQVFDRVRGTSNPNNISPDLPDGPVNGELTAFSATDGFTLVHNGAVGRANTSGDAYVAYAFKAGGSASTTSPAGTIASSTSVADHGGFSIGTFTAPSTSSTAFTVGHGLSRVPTMITVKTLGAAGGWWTWIDEFAATGNYLRFDASGGTYSDGTFLSATPTDEVFATNTSWLTTDHEHSFYAFAKTSGLIASGTFVGTGVTDGSYIVMDDGASGFRPAWFMFKHLSGGGSWYIVDSARNTYNTGTAVGTAKLLLDNNKTEATIHSETTNGILDFTANGVKFRGSNGSDFQGSGTFFYLAFAENPFGGDGVAQAKAR